MDDTSGGKPSLAESGTGLASRIGLWLGIAAFLLLLWLPPTGRMRDTARQQFRERLPAEIEHVLEQSGSPGAPVNSDTWRQAEARVVDAHAERMMAAAAVTALVAIWWMTVAIPIPVTSLLPLVLFPLVGVMPIDDAALPYANPNVFLFLGGFIVALGIERWGLHRRIALRIVAVVGAGRSRLVLGFMIATAFLSMWISNTATVMLMLPIGLAVIRSLETFDDEPDPNFAVALMLGVAYAASIGGIGTPIGTPPNLALRGQWETLFPDRQELGFGTWIVAFLPLVIVFVPIVWLVLVRGTCRLAKRAAAGGREVVRRELARLGPLLRPERMMLFVFLLTGLLWMTRSIPLGPHDNIGWAPLLERALRPGDGTPPPFRAGDVHDATVALAMAALLFILPAGRDETGRRRAMMDWQTASRLPWGILLLFGGGFSIAAAMKASGLSLWCGQVLSAMPVHNPILLLLATCLLITFLTEITSNTATTQIMLPIVAQAAAAVGAEPLELMLAATLSASCAFMLPVATPPNAIVFGSGVVPMGRMVRSGLVLNFVGAVIVVLTIRFLALPILA